MFNRKTNYLALDFDGVISNSVEECLYSSYNARAANLHKLKIQSLDDIDPDVTREFIRMRNYIHAGADFMHILQAIEDKAVITCQKEFDEFAQKYSQENEFLFDVFYKERDEFSRTNPELWVKLNPLYAGIREFLQNYEPREKLFIITTKRINFAKKILEANDILLLGENMFTADSKRSKKEIIIELLNKLQIQSKNFWFIDDQIDTLIKVQDTRINCVVASWGYNNDEQRNIARKNEITVLSLEEFRSRF